MTGWHKAQIAVAAPGFAPAWVEAGDMVKRGEMALRLVRDDVPVRGRVLDSQGRPVAGVVVRIRAIWEVNDGVDLDAMLASGAVDEEDMSQIARRYGDVARLGDPDLASGSRATLARGPERLDHRRRRSVRGPGDRARPHRPAGVPRRRRGGRHARRDGPPREGAAQGPAAAQPAQGGGDQGPEAAFHGFYPQGTQLVGATFDYIAGPTKPIVGVVRLKGSGKPVEGAIVRGADPGTHTAVTARTDAAGRFRLDGVPKAEFYQNRGQPEAGDRLVPPPLGDYR